MFKNIVRILGGDPHKREIQKLSGIIDAINQLEPEYEKLSLEALRGKTDEFRQRIADGIERGLTLNECLDEILPEAFAVVREISKRTIGLRHFDVQLIGGTALHQGKIAEMRTGEGKTLVATLPLYLNALAGRGAHLVTVNDYLARRDARWMAPIYNGLGLSVGVLQMAARTENGQKAFLVDLERVSAHEDQNQLQLVDRVDAYRADITYGTNSEFGFDYLRDNLTMRMDERVQRGHYYSIVDEVDNILIDEARTPLIISGPASDDTEWYLRMAQVVRPLKPEDYDVDEKDRTVVLTELGEAHVEELLGMPFRDPERPEDITPEQARLIGYLEQALRAQFLYRRNKDYLVQGGKVVIVDEFTGRLMPGRRWSEGLHQAIEAKEGVRVEPENITYATITLQNYFRMYEKLAGMTGTALTEAEEFAKIYKLEVLPIPTNLEYVAMQRDSDLVETKMKDEQGYEVYYYTAPDDSQHKPVYWRRKDFPDIVFRTEEGKLRAITREIIRVHVQGRPQLVGTTSVEHSEGLSYRLQAELLRRLLQILLIRQAWIDQNKIEFVERAIPELQPLSKPLTEVDPSEIRQLARQLNISLSMEDPVNLDKLIQILDLKPEHKSPLTQVIQNGIPHQVLNARKHDEESQIIASAGAFGAVTIATNMAGRGVDIKLGGLLPEDILQDVIRVLGRTGEADPYNMTNEERRQALLKMDPALYGIYEEQVKAFLNYMQQMERVRELGGLHVVGSERHEARRIDNQLRGRAARQGDPGSSRFYLSLEDELMRLFGGQQVENLFKRLNVDENLPIEHNLVGRLVEQSQTRVEGNNFDVRKHLLEYDDVLNSQRKRIYSQRDMVFTKEDLSEDVDDMLSTELQQRIPVALKDEGGPWKLLAYLEEIQPTIEYENILYPSFSIRLLLEEIKRNMPDAGEPASRLRAALLALAERSLQAEKDHLVQSIRSMLEKSEEAYQEQLKDRMETLDTFLEGLEDDEEASRRRPTEVLAQLSEQVRAPLKLSTDEMRQLPENNREIKENIRRQIEAASMVITVNRIIAAVDRRMEESTGLRAAQFQNLDWQEVREQIIQTVDTAFNKRFDRLLGSEGQIPHDLDPLLDHMEEAALVEENNVIRLLGNMAQGTRLAFDRRTHRQGRETFRRLNYVYLAAHLMENRTPQALTDEVIEHLSGAQHSLELAWGKIEWNRVAQAEASLSKLDERLQNQLKETLGPEHFAEVADLPVASLSAADRDVISEMLGRRLQNEAYRQILLSILSEQWVDYLTRVEALRISIGLEAYAQRDPLVQYKGKASDMFQSLLADIRLAVIGRMFTYAPRRAATAAVEHEAEEEKETVEVQESALAPVPQNESQEQKKKKRRRH
jgi:preprotein translocase subunit SecA